MTAAGKDYALVLSLTDLLYCTTAKREATAEELCEEMKSTWRSSGGSDKGAAEKVTTESRQYWPRQASRESAESVARKDTRQTNAQKRKMERKISWRKQRVQLAME